MGIITWASRLWSGPGGGPAGFSVSSAPPTGGIPGNGGGARAGSQGPEPFGFCFRLLRPDEIDAFLGLQQTVLDTLEPKDRGFFLPKTERDLTRYLAGAGLIIGVFSGGELIAQSVLSLPLTPDSEAELRILRPGLDPRAIGVFKSSMVHPRYRGFQLQRAMLQTRITFLKWAGRNHALSEIAVRNTASLKGFLESNFKVVAIREDPSDGTPLYYVHLPLGRERYDERLESISCHRVNDLAFQRELLERSFIGVNLNDGQEIVYRRAPNARSVIWFR